MANVNGIFQRQTIHDTRGRTDNSVGGYGNTVSFRGDKGANTFDIGGMRNAVDVNNLGKDDRVNLQGPGWMELPDSNSRDGKVSYYNALTGNYAEVKTDGGRDDNFVRARVNGANGACACGAWNALGNAASNASSYLQGYLAGQRNGYAAGRAHEQQMPDYGWGVTLSVGFRAWSI
ncbi:MAG: hypothetical protein IPG45_30905 [Deltaproteobacteria bacterium]|nr:hypothetical protein [Deltaproteobacteria bacterium]